MVPQQGCWLSLTCACFLSQPRKACKRQNINRTTDPCHSAFSSFGLISSALCSFKTAGVQFHICIQNPRHKTAFLCVKITASEIWSCGGISRASTVSISGRIKRPMKSGSLVQVSREPPLPAGVCILHLTWILTCTATSLNIQLYKCKMRWGWLPFRDFSFREAPESVPVMWGVQLRSVQRAQPGFCLSSLPESSVWNSRAFLIPFPASRGCRQPTLYV